MRKIVGSLALLVLVGAAPLSRWRVEAESPAARVTERGGVIDVDTPKGLTLWWREPVRSPVTISFEAMAVSAGGSNDQVSDLNAFWMASDAAGDGAGDGAGSGPPMHRRSGAFADYDDLRTYYLGIGGNRNTTTRLRRYIGEKGNRPILSEHDKAGAADLLVANRWTRIRLIADGRTIAVERDGRRLFTLDDPEPYTRGHWGLRTTWSHLRFRHVRVVQR